MRTSIAILLLTLGVAHAGKSSAKAQARVDAAMTAYAGVRVMWQAGSGNVDAVGVWSERWLAAQRDQPLKGKALIAAIDDNLARMQELADAVQKLYTAGTATQVDVDIAAYYLAEAELWDDRAHKR